VAELFQDITQAVTSPSRRAGAGTVLVQPAKQLPKSSSQQKQTRKTVGSQARMSDRCDSVRSETKCFWCVY